MRQKYEKLFGKPIENQEIFEKGYVSSITNDVFYGKVGSNGL